MTFKRIWATVLAAALLMPSSCAMANNKLINIAELYAQTRDGWQGEYQAAVKSGGMQKGDTFMVDINIDVPNVSACPIVELKVNTDLLFDEHAKNRFPNAKGIGILTMTTMDQYSTEKPLNLSYYDYEQAVSPQAPDNPLSPEDAQKLLSELTEKYFHVSNLEIASCVAFSNEITQDAYLDSLSDIAHGWYQIKALQIFEGIPVLASGLNTTRWFPSPSVSAQIYDDTFYNLSGATVTQVGTLDKDVPLLPWRDIQSVIEKLIKSGKIMHVYSVKLGYQIVLFDKGKDNSVGYLADRKSFPEGTFSRTYQVRPVWQVLAYQTDAYASDEIAGELPIARLIRPGTYILLDAQTGNVVYDYVSMPVSDSIDVKLIGR